MQQDGGRNRLEHSSQLELKTPLRERVEREVAGVVFHALNRAECKACSLFEE